MQNIYIEEHIQHHPRVAHILSRFKNKTIITCKHYGEVFNRKNQNFRQQKQNPDLILAEKKGKKVLPAPDGFGIASHRNFYFSHLLNCPFDCRYCFLQGLYRSANYVLFINYEDFFLEIESTIKDSKSPCVFFSGYDADSLAYEPITHFTESFLPFFKQHKTATLELRTKSANIQSLLKHSPSDNIVVAFSFTPHDISKAIEHKVPSLDKRLTAMRTVADHGYPIGVRLDPLIYADNFEELYHKLISDIFQNVKKTHIHSVSIGPLRFPKKMHETIRSLYPNDPLIQQPLQSEKRIISYPRDKQETMEITIRKLLSEHIDPEHIFSCLDEATPLS